MLARRAISRWAMAWATSRRPPRCSYTPSSAWGVGGAHEHRLDPGRGPGGPALGHGGAGHPRVPLVDRLADGGAGRPGGHDVHPGGGDVGLHGVVAEAGPRLEKSASSSPTS